MKNSRNSTFIVEVLKAVRNLSKDPSTQVASVAFDSIESMRILASGYNGFAKGYPDDYKTVDRNEKLLLTIHSEVNLVANAARNGVSLVGSAVAISEPPCPQCLSTLINAGVEHLMFPPFEECAHYERWKEQFDLSKRILSKVEMDYSLIQLDSHEFSVLGDK